MAMRERGIRPQPSWRSLNRERISESRRTPVEVALGREFITYLNTEIGLHAICNCASCSEGARELVKAKRLLRSKGPKKSIAREVREAAKRTSIERQIVSFRNEIANWEANQ